MSRRALARIAGALWCVGSLALFTRSASLFRIARDTEQRSTAVLWLAIGAGLAIGAAKGWFVLRKTAARNLLRIGSLGEPTRPWQAFPPAFYPLIAVMIGMGVGIRMLAARGLPGGHLTALAVYVAIGAALLGSSMPYWRFTGPSDQRGA